ncbi:hypothetical protein EPN96_09695 [bacterium]|nr:MAG: hypothetical protein EPN96_09695 [bacterium]
MKNLLYYPSFEVADETWLKFALLYFNELQPIVPYSGEQYLSGRFREIIDSTDLIKFYRPDYKKGVKATKEAIETCESMLSRPYAFKDFFKCHDFINVWKSPEFHTHTIFREKYSDAWEDFLTKNKLGTPSDNGIAVSEHLALIYMTLLAQAISANDNMSPITDIPEIDKFSISCLSTSPATPKCVDVARFTIPMVLPANLQEISINSIIKLRNKSGFKQKLIAFNHEIESFIKSLEGSNNSPETIAKDFMEFRSSLWREFSDDVIAIGSGAIPAALGIWLVIDAENFDKYNYIKEATAATALLVTSIISIRNTWQDSKNRRHTRRYLSDLKQLKASI